MKDVKPILTVALAQSETMIVERILVRILPVLIQHGLTLTAEQIKTAPSIPVPDEVYALIHRVTEELVGTDLNNAQE